MSTDPTAKTLDENLRDLKNTGGAKAFKVCGDITECTVELLDRNKMELVENCFNDMAATYDRTDDTVIRVAIENVFLYKLGDYMMLAQNREECMNLMPGVFKDVLRRQVLAAGY